jgi:hypothetical protein
MEFRMARTEFPRGLRLAQGIAGCKSTMPRPANVLLRTQGKISCWSPGPHPDGKIVIPLFRSGRTCAAQLVAELAPR